MSNDRARQGWKPPDLGAARLELAPNPTRIRELVESAPSESIHICQGIRANGLVGVAQRILAARQLRQWVVMETVDDAGWRGALKRLEYRRLFTRNRSVIEGVLANGHRTPNWLASRGVPPQNIFPFAYFLPDQLSSIRTEHEGPFRYIFVGQFIELKRLDLLIESLSELSCNNLELAVVGSGPLENDLRQKAESALPNRVRWIGRLAADDVPHAIANADCLVLPSRHDGWGAVISEALMVGTPVICSDACGAAGVVKASGHGAVFPTDDRDALRFVLMETVRTGRLAEGRRAALADWARCLGAKQGAQYLRAVLNSRSPVGPKPPVPWEMASQVDQLRDGSVGMRI